MDMEPEPEEAVNFPAINPLLIPHIVEQVLKHTCFENSDFLIQRLVCKEWNRVATNYFEQIVTLEGDSDVERMKKVVKILKNPDANMPAVKELWLRRKFFPKRDTSELEFQRTLGNYLDLVSHQVMDLFMEMNLTTELLFDESCYSDMVLPKLNALQLDLNGRDDDEAEGNFFFNLSQKILRASSNLSALIIKTNPIGVPGTAFGNKILQNIPRSVQTLRIVGGFNKRHHVKVFSSLLFTNLTSLSLTINSFTITGNEIYQLLGNSKNLTLRTLNLQLEQMFTKMSDFQLPIFPELLSLRLTVNGLEAAPETVLRFRSVFPKVRELTLYGTPTEELMSSLFPIGFAAPEVQTCDWNQFLGLEDAHILNLVQGFSGLKKLHVGSLLTDSASKLSTLFQWCPLLEGLHFSLDDKEQNLGTNLDSILTGIPAEVIEDIRNNPDWAEIDLAVVKAGPGLSDLEDLKDLVITIPPNLATNNITVTNITVLFGILKLPLEKLRINKFKISDDFIYALKQRFGDYCIMCAEE